MHVYVVLCKFGFIIQVLCTDFVIVAVVFVFVVVVVVTLNS